MPIKSEFFPDLNIIEEKYEGRIDLAEILDSKKDQVKPDTPLDFSLIVDMTDAELDMTSTDIDRMVDFFKEFRDLYRNTRVALVTGGRSETALSYMYAEMVKTENLGYEVEVFSTSSAARSWVLNKKT